MKIEKCILGVAGEFAVAAELCRRNIYAQLTLGNQKGVDLLTLSRAGRFLKIEVKSKQGKTWPNQRGLPPGDGFLVFVDFADREDLVRHDFFVLSADEWRAVALCQIARYLERNPNRNAIVDERSCPVFPDQINSSGKPYCGCSICVSDIEEHREKWSKITAACTPVTAVPSSES
jgi:hypothetical protein